MKFLILGSCVTRDAFNGREEQLTGYYARSSFISLVSDPIPLEEEAIMNASSFQRRVIAYDFNKTFFKTLAIHEGDYLIIDLIEERFNLLSWKGKMITQSSELLTSQIQGISLEEFALIGRLNKETHKMWEASCDQVLERIKQYIPENHIIVHRVTWATTYKEQDKIKPFPQERQDFIRLNNQMLEGYYDYIERNFPRIKVIKVPDALVVGDKEHKWGLTPYHYCKAYNEVLEKELFGDK